jgi:UDP-glucose 4-epimerase
VKTILVTGGAGFVGSNLCKRLVADGHKVISLDNYFAGSRENHISGVEYREGHTKDIGKHVPEKVDLIYHLGEYARVEQSVLEPDIVHDLNTVGTTGVIEYWRARKCKLLYAGSSTKFGDGGAARKTSPYAATKAANTEKVKETGEHEGLPYAITYFYNVYGPGERAGVYGTVIENFKRSFLRGAPLAVTSPGTQLRNFTHVDDIVEGLILVGEKGEGDEYGLGNEHAYAILDIAKLFGSEVVMMPARAGNRMQSGLDTTKSNALGWQAKISVKDYIAEFIKHNPPAPPLEKRVLIFTTTFHPISGPAEDALLDVIQAMQDMHFDVITTAYSREAAAAQNLFKNVHIHRVGQGKPTDKYLLPVLGFRAARALRKKHQYLFTWAVLASYGAAAALLLRRTSGLPLLLTLADQDLSKLSISRRAFLRFALTDADQVYGGDSKQESDAARVSGKALRRRSLGDGDAFANAMRFAYSNFLLKRRDL